ncbi:MAG: tetratricopeptide repeat protein [Candidatus Rifleibacteriota bacterium]
MFAVFFFCRNCVQVPFHQLQLRQGVFMVSLIEILEKNGFVKENLGKIGILEIGSNQNSGRNHGYQNLCGYPFSRFQKIEDLERISEINFSIDFLKIDNQSLKLPDIELVLASSKSLLAIEADVAWIPASNGMPLFSEIEGFLRRHGFLLHRLIETDFRCLNPAIPAEKLDSGLQMISSRAVFIRDFSRFNELSPSQLLKLAVILSEAFRSSDLALYALKEFDLQMNNQLSELFQKELAGEETGSANESASSEPTKDYPTDFVSLYSLGVDAFNHSNFSEALDLFARASLLQPGFAQVFFNLGLSAGRLGRYSDALNYLDRCIGLDPSFDEARKIRKTIAEELIPKSSVVKSSQPTTKYADKLRNAIELQGKNQLTEAEAIFLEILTADPGDFPSLFSLGGIEQNRRNPQKALEYFSRAMAVKPDYPALWYNIGVVQQSMKRFDEALASYDKALELDPEYSEVLLNRGGVLVEMKRHRDALMTFEELLKKDPGNAKALCNRGILLTDFKLYDLAIETFAKLVEVDPDFDYALGLYGFAKMHACDWTNLEPIKQSIIEGVKAEKRVCKSLAFTAISYEPSEHLVCAQVFARHFFPAHEPLWHGEVYAHQKLKIAYVSPDFREHPVGHLSAGLFEAHDRSRFEIIGVSLGVDDGSPMRKRMEKAFDKFIDARPIPSFELASMLKSMNVDVLVDMAGYTADSRTDVFSYRPAPVQVNYLGYSSTLGLDYIDYIIADRHIIPKNYRNCYSEKVVYLPDTYLPTDSRVEIAATTPPRPQYGLPEEGFIFCSFNHDYKINSQIFDVWMRLLKKVEGSVLWLMKLNESAERNLRKEAENRGIDPGRIVFATRVPSIADHLARYRMADLFLDTSPCNAHSTSSDVLRAGLPLITCRGKAFASRVAAGLLSVVGLEELITDNLTDYEALALKLAQNPDYLLKIREKLAQNLETSRLFDTDYYCRNLEAAYEEMVKRARAGLPPDSFAVPRQGRTTGAKND